MRGLSLLDCRTDKIPLGTKGRTSVLSYREYVRPAELHSLSAEESRMTENVASLHSGKVATPPCAANAAIPRGLAVFKQHEMLFAASKLQKKYDGGTQFEKSCKNSFDRSLLRLDFVIA